MITVQNELENYLLQQEGQVAGTGWMFLLKNERGNEMTRPSFEEFKKQALEQPGVKADYERLAPAFELRRKLIEIRLAAGFTQEQMAAVLKTQKSNISRLESVNSKISPTLSTIERYANAAGYRLEINFVPETRS